MENNYVFEYESKLMSHYLVAKVKSSEILDWENVNLSCIELDCNSSVLITRLNKYVKFCGC